MQDKIAFVEFYESNNISPVSQDISDLNRHFQRRESLFRSLGVLPNLIEGAKILEFGPGSGHNALYSASLKPQEYDLVDGNLRGVKETRERLSNFPEVKIEVHHTLFDAFKSDKKFDLVWAEGCLPHQSQPLLLLEHIASFSKEGGVVCVSQSNGVSYLSEIFRRLFRDRFFDPVGTVYEQARVLTPHFQPHLSSLRGMSRPVEDWILDSIVQPMRDRRLLSIPEVITCLSDQFDVYGSSPRFLTDWRWYKEVVGSDRGLNDLALKSYYRNNLNLLDYRFEFPEHSLAFGEKLEDLCQRSWNLMCRIEYGEESVWQDFFALMTELLIHITKLAPITAEAISEASNLLQNGSPKMEMNQFSHWWGRGQQYLSLIRKNSHTFPFQG